MNKTFKELMQTVIANNLTACGLNVIGVPVIHEASSTIYAQVHFDVKVQMNSVWGAVNRYPALWTLWSEAATDALTVERFTEICHLSDPAVAAVQRALYAAMAKDLVEHMMKSSTQHFIEFDGWDFDIRFEFLSFNTDEAYAAVMREFMTFNRFLEHLEDSGEIDGCLNMDHFLFNEPNPEDEDDVVGEMSPEVVYGIGRHGLTQNVWEFDTEYDEEDELPHSGRTEFLWDED